MDFSTYIQQRTQYFSGREWVFKAINDWFLNPATPRIFLLVGGPGTGKTAIAARLAQFSSGDATQANAPSLSKGWLTYNHFCQAGVEGTLSPLSFVQSLSEALANRYPAFRAALEKKGSPQIAIYQTVGTAQPGANVVGANISQVRIEIRGADARPLFDQAVRIPLQELSKELPDESITILVDSLDEALTFNEENNITQLLKLVTDFPQRTRFVLTCRSNSERVFNLLGLPTLDLIANAPPGIDEVELYAASRLSAIDEPKRSMLAKRVADKSGGNFLYAFHVLNDLVSNGDTQDPNTIDLPDELEDVYRKFIQREMASNPTRWNDIYRPLLGPIVVARGNGLTKAQLIGITELAEDTASDVLNVCAQYLVSGDHKTQPYRIYHQSFRDFLLADQTYTIYPAERHAAIARYFQDECGANWRRCDDQYGLRYTPVHWADSATLSEVKRETRTQSLIRLTSNKKYLEAFETNVGDLPTLHEYLQRSVKVAALNDRDDMLPWLLRAAKQFGAFRQDYLRGDAVVVLANQGNIEQAQKRLTLFTELDEHWQIAARLIIAWLGLEQNKTAAKQLRDEVVQNLPSNEPLRLLRDRFEASVQSQATFAVENVDALPLEIGQQLVNRVSGQGFDQEMLTSVNPSFITKLGFQSEMINKGHGYASNFDGPILVQMARVYGAEGTELVDQYVDAHAGYNYVEYRNRSLWMVLHAVLRNHPDQTWVKERLRHLLITALTGGGVDFSEMLSMTGAVFSEIARGRDPRAAMDGWRVLALQGAAALQNRRGANDSWGNHKRRLTALMELYHLLLSDEAESGRLFDRISALPEGFAGFQAPATLRLADALVACRKTASIENTLKEALIYAHHIQDYHFCARITARCNAVIRWHNTPLSLESLIDTIGRLASSPSSSEFAADHEIHERYQYRSGNPEALSIANAHLAETLEQLVEVFQRPAVEFRRLNPEHNLTEKLAEGTPIRIPDPGLAPLLAVHLAARVLAADDPEMDQATLIRSLVPIAVTNPTALDTVLSYLLISVKPDDADLVDEMISEIGPVEFANIAVSTAQIGPDPATPT